MEVGRGGQGRAERATHTVSKYRGGRCRVLGWSRRRKVLWKFLKGFGMGEMLRALRGRTDNLIYNGFHGHFTRKALRWPGSPGVGEDAGSIAQL